MKAHTPHEVHFSQIFHRGYMDFKWSSPLYLTFRIYVTSQRVFAMHTSVLAHLLLPLAYFLTNLSSARFNLSQSVHHVHSQNRKKNCRCVFITRRSRLRALKIFLICTCSRTLFNQIAHCYMSIFAMCSWSSMLFKYRPGA